MYSGEVIYDAGKPSRANPHASLQLVSEIFGVTNKEKPLCVFYLLFIGFKQLKVEQSYSAYNKLSGNEI